ncbi:MAG: hypothetical protein ACPK7O_10255 [Methanobacterium sp.]
MIQVLEVFRIDNYERWKRSYEDGEGDRRANGSREAFVYRNKDNASEIVILHQWGNLENAKNFFESSEFKDRMKKAGVRGEPLIQYFEEIDRIIG